MRLQNRGRDALRKTFWHSSSCCSFPLCSDVHNKILLAQRVSFSATDSLAFVAYYKFNDRKKTRTTEWKAANGKRGQVKRVQGKVHRNEWLRSGAKGEVKGLHPQYQRLTFGNTLSSINSSHSTCIHSNDSFSGLNHLIHKLLRNKKNTILLHSIEFSRCHSTFDKHMNIKWPTDCTKGGYG